jgi:CHASE2 domain-containing sensor protein
VVIGTLVAMHGVAYLFAAVILTGILQIAFGLFKLGKFIRLVPHPVFLGFVNGPVGQRQPPQAPRLRQRLSMIKYHFLD